MPAAKQKNKKKEESIKSARASSEGLPMLKDIRESVQGWTL